MRYINLIIGLIISPFFYSQEIFPEDLPKELPKKFQITLDMDSVNYYSNHKKEAKEKIYNSLDFISQFNEKEIFESGLIALNYSSIELYLNKIVSKLIPNHLIEKLDIHVYPSLGNDINAFALPSNTILFNTYNFIYLENEAEVAFILAHEIGHLLNESNAEMEWLKYMNSFDFFSEKKRKYENASQGAEISADKKAADMLIASGYRNDAAISVQNLFQKINEKYKQLVYYREGSYLKTHPSSIVRLDSAKKWINNIEYNSHKNYLVDSLFFLKIKNKSRIHSIKNSFNNHDYITCLELSIEGYLSEEDSSQYPYYISETIRRLMYTKVCKENQTLFLGIYKGMFQLGLYNILDKKIFLSNGKKERIEELQNNKIYTYKKAFDYFSKKSKDNNDTEILLTIGLYEFVKSKQKKDSFLRDYIKSDGKNKAFALQLTNGKLNEKPKSLFIYNKFTAINYQGKKPIKLYFLENSMTAVFDSILEKRFNEVCPYQDKTYLNLSKNLIYNYDKTLFFKKITSLIDFTTLIKNGDKFNVTYIDPSLGTFMALNEYTTLQYIDLVYHPGTPVGLAVMGGIYGVTSNPKALHINTLHINQKKEIAKGYKIVHLGSIKPKIFDKSISNTVMNKKNYPIK